MNPSIPSTLQRVWLFSLAFFSASLIAPLASAQIAIQTSSAPTNAYLSGLNPGGAVSADGSTFFDGLTVDNTNGIVDQPQLPRFKAWTNYDNYVGVGTWTKIGLNNTDYNDQGAFDAGTNLFTAPVDGTYLFGATLLYKVNSSTSARMRGRLALNGTTEIRGSFGESSATHVSLATAIWLQTMVTLTAGDTVELQGYFRAQDGYFAADHTSLWGCKVG